LEEGKEGPKLLLEGGEGGEKDKKKRESKGSLTNNELKNFYGRMRKGERKW